MTASFRPKEKRAHDGAEVGGVKMKTDASRVEGQIPHTKCEKGSKKRIKH